MLFNQHAPSASESNPTEQGEKSEACNQSMTLKSHSSSDVGASCEVIDHMPRLDFKINPQGGTLISYQYEYVDYLDEISCIDPQTAKENLNKANKVNDKK